MILLRLYASENGKELFKDWIEGLNDLVAVENINNRVLRLAVGQCGDFDRIDKNLYELRIHFGPGYRVYFGKHGNSIILLLGGIKNGQKKDIEKSKNYWKYYLEQFDEKNKRKKSKRNHR